ncbi:unnamed protein product [Caenorhabditis brenneri]
MEFSEAAKSGAVWSGGHESSRLGRRLVEGGTCNICKRTIADFAAGNFNNSIVNRSENARKHHTDLNARQKRVQRRRSLRGKVSSRRLEYGREASLVWIYGGGFSKCFVKKFRRSFFVVSTDFIKNSSHSSVKLINNSSSRVEEEGFTQITSNFSEFRQQVALGTLQAVIGAVNSGTSQHIGTIRQAVANNINRFDTSTSKIGESIGRRWFRRNQPIVKSRIVDRIVSNVNARGEGRAVKVGVGVTWVEDVSRQRFWCVNPLELGCQLAPRDSGRREHNRQGRLALARGHGSGGSPCFGEKGSKNPGDDFPQGAPKDHHLANGYWFGWFTSLVQHRQSRRSWRKPV